MEENTPKKLSSILIEAMQSRNLTLEKLAVSTNISERFLEPLLTDDFKLLPASPYLHGYIIKIGTTLGLDGEELWNTYFKNNEDIRRSGKTDELPKNRFEKTHMNKKVIVAGALGILFLIFIVWRVQAYFAPPSLSFENLADNMVVESGKFTLRGNTNPSNQLFLNGEQIYPSPNGNFEKELELQPGWNAFSFKVKKFLGSEYTYEKQIFRKTDETPAPQGTTTLEIAPKEEENNDTTINSTTTR